MLNIANKLSLQSLRGKARMIKYSCNKPKICAKCQLPIYSFEKRNNRNDGAVEHLKGQCNGK